MELNTAYALEGVGAFRISAFRQKGSPAVVVRFIPGSVPAFDTLGLPDVLKEIIMQKRGLILMVGATGSGKSTSLSAMLDFRNEQKSGHILTLEDPVEFIFKNKKSIVNQREVGTDTKSFEVALKNALRQAPDCILIGEIRDKQTMGMALAYAQSGHLALATLHANNSYHAMNQIISFYPLENRPTLLLDLSAALQAVILQRLVRTKTGARRGGGADQYPPRQRTDREGQHQREQGGHGEEHGPGLADLRAVPVQDVHGWRDHARGAHVQRGFRDQYAVADQPGHRRRDLHRRRRAAACVGEEGRQEGQPCGVRGRQHILQRHQDRHERLSVAFTGRDLP